MVNCKLNQIFLGEIASVQNYGAFIRIPGCASQGLLHRSQVSNARVDDVAQVLQKGERVWCKIISMGDDGKIGLSMKYVNQGNGTDLDPNGVELQRDAQKKKSFGKYEHKAIHLEAVLNTTCTKCGTAGHLSNDCFMSPDGKKYDLIPEIEEEVVQQPIDENEKEKKHKQKKVKKKHKLKKNKQGIDNSDSDEKEITKKKKRKHSKDQKKKKKRKHDSSFSDDSSNDSSSSHNVKVHKRKHSESSEKRTKKCKHSKSKYPDR
ncbi:zinc finger CCHC domain-containing protein 17 isoform X1 [Megalopta genalis]|uniref:zinc finger CCHC domain-containing protein 17 isoform X1 n=1 Tax=Megalopta genalis TaxID=115081 RepID=UPI003FD3A655